MALTKKSVTLGILAGALLAVAITLAVWKLRPPTAPPAKPAAEVALGAEGAAQGSGTAAQASPAPGASADFPTPLGPPLPPGAAGQAGSPGSQGPPAPAGSPGLSAGATSSANDVLPQSAAGSKSNWSYGPTLDEPTAKSPGIHARIAALRAELAVLEKQLAATGAAAQPEPAYGATDYSKQTYPPWPGPAAGPGSKIIVLEGSQAKVYDSWPAAAGKPAVAPAAKPSASKWKPPASKKSYYKPAAKKAPKKWSPPPKGAAPKQAQIKKIKQDIAVLRARVKKLEAKVWQLQN